MERQISQTDREGERERDIYIYIEREKGIEREIGDGRPNFQATGDRQRGSETDM